MELEILKEVSLSELKLNDSFFDSLKEDYKGFDKWFIKKAKEGHKAYVKFDDFNNIKAFLMLQLKEEVEDDIIPLQDNKKRLKISTLKIDVSSKSQRLSEAMINIIFDSMDYHHVDESYITLFKDKQDGLYKVLSAWGFIETGSKNKEIVMTKFKNKITHNIKKNYKWYFNNNFFDTYKNSNFYLLPFESQYHDKLLPKNGLKNVANSSTEFNVSSISITKTYISMVRYTTIPKKGDFVLEYRMGKLMPKYQSVVTGIGIVYEVFDARMDQFDEFFKKVGNTSVFSEEELRHEFNKGRKIIIKFLHFYSFGEGNNINLHTLREKGIWPDRNDYLPAHPIYEKEKVYNLILREYKKHENIIVNS